MNHAAFDLAGAGVWILFAIYMLRIAYLAAHSNRNADGSWKPGHLVNMIVASLFFLAAFVALVYSWVQYGWMLEVCR
jgi:hypothetical protein